jgi:ankyrin repeat protein
MKRQLFLLTLFIYTAGNINAMNHHAVNGSQDPQALIKASQKGDLAQVKALIAAGAQVNIQDGNGITALHWAALKGSLAIAQELINADSHLNMGDKLGETALKLAATKGHLAVVQALVTAGADIDTAFINRRPNRADLWEVIEEGQKERKLNQE